jgi:hypothetical protein
MRVGVLEGWFGGLTGFGLFFGDILPVWGLNRLGLELELEML